MISVISLQGLRRLDIQEKNSKLLVPSVPFLDTAIIVTRHLSRICSVDRRPIDFRPVDHRPVSYHSVIKNDSEMKVFCTSQVQQRSRSFRTFFRTKHPIFQPVAAAKPFRGVFSTIRHSFYPERYGTCQETRINKCLPVFSARIANYLAHRRRWLFSKKNGLSRWRWTCGFSANVKDARRVDEGFWN